VCAAFFAAAERPAAPFVAAAFFAAAERLDAGRFAAAVFVCFDSASFDAPRPLSRFSTASETRERFAVVSLLGLRAAVFLPAVFATAFLAAMRFAAGDFCWPAAESAAAFWRVPALAVPAFGCFSATPARRAFDKPIAIACFADFTPCLPSRTWSISSFTNSPAWVPGDLPARLSAAARLRVALSGMTVLPFDWWLL
jgi:hypothetical protein